MKTNVPFLFHFKTSTSQNYKKIFIFLFASLLSPFSLAGEHDFTEYAASYQLSWHGVSAGISEHILKKIGDNRYSAESISKPYLSIIPFGNSERSEFTLEESNIIPQRYDFKTEEKGKTIVGFVDFDWANNSLLKSVQDGGERKEELTEGVQDRITYTLQMRQDLKNKKPVLSYTVIEPKRVKHYTFHVIGDEKVTTSLGTFDTVKLEHVSDNGDRRTLIWMAKDFDYLLIKLVQYKDNSLDSEAILKTLRVLNPKSQIKTKSNSSEHRKEAL